MIKKVLFGSEKYLVKEEVSRLTKNRNTQKVDLTVDGSIETALTQQSFFGADLFYVITSPTLEDAKGVLECESRYDLIVLPEEVDKRKALYKSLSKIPGMVEEYNHLSGKALKDAVFKMAEGAITDEAYNEILIRTNYGKDESTDLMTIHKYVSQCLILDSAVTLSRVREVVPEASPSSFVLSKALIKGDAVTLFSAASELLEKGENEISLLALMQRPFRLAYLSQFGDVGYPDYTYKDALALGLTNCAEILDIVQEATDRFKSGAKDSLFVLTLARCLETLHGGE